MVKDLFATFLKNTILNMPLLLTDCLLPNLVYGVWCFASSSLSAFTVGAEVEN